MKKLLFLTALLIGLSAYGQTIATSGNAIINGRGYGAFDLNGDMVV